MLDRICVEGTKFCILANFNLQIEWQLEYLCTIKIQNKQRSQRLHFNPFNQCALQWLQSTKVCLVMKTKEWFGETCYDDASEC